MVVTRTTGVRDFGDQTYAQVMTLEDENGEPINPANPTLANNEGHIGQVGGSSIAVRVERTRPANTTAYAANDAINGNGVSTNWEFVLGRIATGSGVIVGANVATDHAAGTAVLELDLYDASITLIADNDEATRLYANQGKYIGTIVFPALAKKTAGSTQAEATNTDIRYPFKCVGASKVYGILRTPAGFTPASAAAYQVTLHATQD